MKYLRLFCLLICICFSYSSYCFCTVCAAKATKAPKATKSPKATKAPKASKEPKSSSSPSANSSGSPDTSSSTEGFTCPNDGKEKSADEVFKDSGITSSFKDVEYWDCAVPYELSFGDIGGYQVKTRYNVDAQGHSMSPMASSVQKQKVGSVILYETHVGSDFGVTHLGNVYQKMVDAGKKVGKFDVCDENGMAKYINKQGVEFYFTAVQPWFFANGVWKEKLKGAKKFAGTYGSGTIGWGEIFDVILTDGTCIHFVYADTNAAEHTNGMTKQYESYAAELKLKQYKNLFGAEGGHMLEVWLGHGSSGLDKFKKATGLDGKKKIAYYRFYNKSMIDDVEPADENAKKVVSSVTSGEGDPYSGNGANNKKNEELNAVAVNGFYSEEALSNYVKLHEAYLTDMINNANRDSLGQEDLSNLSNWNMNKSEDKGEGFVIKVTRKITMILGVILTVYAVLIYIAFWFDRTNIFMDIDVLGILTFGRMSAIMDDTDSNYKRDMGDRGKKLYVDSKSITKIILLVVSFGALIISGVIFGILLKLVNLIFGLIQGF